MSDSPNNQGQQEDILLDHNYDGIQEFDNPLPGWWKALFWATILYCVPYTWWYHFSEGNTIIEKYDAAVAAKAAKDAEAEKALSANVDTGPNLARGQSLYAAKGCTACHAADGGGSVGLGPNLCDDNYKNVKEYGDLAKVIKDGVAGTAMVAQPLSDSEVRDVAAYVASLRGTTPANPKEAEGEVIPPWPAE